ncbi:piggyBac transposable element-derived protein 3-like [Hydra vulgaris]|uniref:PiggyBac transposable element-derived protein 3-like n=1 Tax=Hydra vulgaris TaxID=6087 RepID=A0ABM4BNP0_HYDVU
MQSDDEDMKNWEPIEFYKKFPNNSIFELIVEESNRYAIQCNPSSPLNLSCNELEQFIGILYAMSLVKTPSTRLYWSKEFYFEKVAGTMPVNRFEKIKKFLHCSDNLTRPKNFTDRLYKIRPLVDHLQKQFLNLKPSELLCIDEQIVPFKGKSGLKQYNPKKPKKWGYKLYILSGIDGLIYNFQVHTGAIDVCLNQPNLKASGNIVLTLLQHIPRNKWYKLFCDNWYTGVDLFKILHDQGIGCLGTVRANRLSKKKLHQINS